jgi:hypothetical protein
MRFHIGAPPELVTIGFDTIVSDKHFVFAITGNVGGGVLVTRTTVKVTIPKTSQIVRIDINRINVR